MVHLVKDSVDGQWLTFPFPFVHHQPRPYLSWSTSVFSFSWSKGERTGEDRRLSTVEKRTFLHGWPCPLASKLLIARGRHWPATKRYSRQTLTWAPNKKKNRRKGAQGSKIPWKEKQKKERKVHGILNASSKICSLVVNGQSFLVTARQDTTIDSQISLFERILSTAGNRLKERK